MTRSDILYEALQKREIPALNGFRAIAVGAVVGYHSLHHWFPGRLGVLVFFVLSGFLITWLLLKEADSTGTVSLRGFYRRRALRIFPAFYVFWILQVLLISPVPWASVLFCAAYLGNYYMGLVLHDATTVMSHTWSLAVEEQFYLLWPAIFVWQRRNLKALAFCLAVGILGVQILRLTLWRLGTNGWYLGTAFETRCDALAIGCFSAVILWFRPALPPWFFSSWIARLAIFVLVAATYVEATDPMACLLYWFGISAVATAVLILQGVAYSDHPSFRWLNHPVMQYLGRISYPIYLYHMLVQSLVHRLPLGFVGKGVIAVVGLVAIASASYAWIEKPFLKLKTRRPATKPAHAIA